MVNSNRFPQYPHLRILSTQYTMASKSFEIYLAGCNAHPKCTDCFSQETWDYEQGTIVTMAAIEEIKNKVDEFSNMLDEIWILGGEPLDHDPSELSNFIEQLYATIHKPFRLFTHYRLFNEEGYMHEQWEKSPYYNFIARFAAIKCGAYIPEQSSENHWVDGLKLATTNQTVWIPLCTKKFIPIKGKDGSAYYPVRSESTQYLRIQPAETQAESAENGRLARQRAASMNDYEYSTVRDEEGYSKFLKRIYSRDNMCPCRIQQSPQSICFCESFREMGEGICPCGMFKKTRKTKEGVTDEG